MYNYYMKTNINKRKMIRMRLLERIKASKFTINEIAKILGINISLIYQYKYTNKLPSTLLLAKICKLINADVNYILGINDDG